VFRHRSHLRLVAPPERGASTAAGVCRRAGCAARAAELGLCPACLTRYRAERTHDRARLEALARELAPALDRRLAGWPAPLRRQLVRNLAAQLLWDPRPAAGADAGHAATVATLADVLDI